MIPEPLSDCAVGCSTHKGYEISPPRNAHPTSEIGGSAVCSGHYTPGVAGVDSALKLRPAPDRFIRLEGMPA